MSDTTLVNARLIRRRRDQLAVSLRTLAAAVGVSPSVIVALEQGRNHPQITLGHLAGIADALSLDLAEVLHTETDAAPTEDPNNDDDADTPTSADPAAVGAILHATGVLTATAALLDVLDWTAARLAAALGTLEADLPAVGLRLHRLNGRVKISGAATAADEDTLARAVRRHLARDGINLTEARLLRTIMTSGVPKELTNAENVALGVLVNAGLVEPGPATAPTSQVPMVLSDDVRYSLGLDEQSPQTDRTEGLT